MDEEEKKKEKEEEETVRLENGNLHVHTRPSILVR